MKKLTKKELNILNALKCKQIIDHKGSTTLFQYLINRYDKSKGWCFVQYVNNKTNESYCLFYQKINNSYRYSDSIYFGKGYINIFENLGYNIDCISIDNESFYKLYAMRHLCLFEIIYHYKM